VAAIKREDRKRSRAKRGKSKKQPFTTRIRNQVTEIASLGSLLVNEPKAFPGALLQVFKRGFRNVWHARGGGLYACGFLVTFVWLELSMFFGEIQEAESFGGFFSGQLIEFLLRFSLLSLLNTMNALIWPFHIISMSPLWGGLAIGGMYVLFAKFAKAQLEQWLFGDTLELDDVNAATGCEKIPNQGENDR
jgi:hypothetical protein